MENKKQKVRKRTLIWIAFSVPSCEVSHAGGKTFKYYFDRFVKDDFFDVKLIGFAEDIPAGKLREEFQTIEYRIIDRGNKIKDRIVNWKDIFGKINPWSRYAGLILYSRAAKVKKYLKEFQAQGVRPDCIILEWTAMVVLASEVKKIFPKAHIIASEPDITYAAWRRKAGYYRGIKGLWWKIKYQCEKKKELEALAMCELIYSSNLKEGMQLLKEGIKRERIQWLVPYFHDMQSVLRHSNGRDILFYGMMEREENYKTAVWFIQNVMPLLADLDVRYVVAGKNPPDILKKYQNDRIKITGYVEDETKYFKTALCFAAPLVLGAGIKVKILEALSSGIPVLTNHIGIEGIPASKDRHYLHCRTANEYADCIRKLAGGELDGEAIGKKGRNLVRNISLEKSFLNYRTHILELTEGEAR